jgi:hypothetical protein
MRNIKPYINWLKNCDAIKVNDSWVSVGICYEVDKLDDVFMRLSHMNEFGEVEEITIIKEAFEYCYFEDGSLYIQNKNGEANKLDKLVLAKNLEII